MGFVLDGLVVVVFAAWLVIAALACVCAYYCQCDPPAISTGYDPSAVVIIPVRGRPEHVDALWRGLCAQIFRSFRIVFAVESIDDPAYAALRSLTGGPAAEIVVAGAAAGRGQKVHNLLAALRTLQPADAVVVFADADILPAADWLSRLIRELADPSKTVASGYRWMVPSDERWSTAFVCAANASIATLLRLPPLSLAWGGSMALRRETLDALDLERIWDRGVSDDLLLSSAVRAHGWTIDSPPDVLVPTPAAFSWREAIAFGRRQYLLVRMHAPRQWILGAGATTLPLLGWAVALPLVAIGDKVAIAALLLANILDHIRARLRGRVPVKLWGTKIPRRMAWLDRWGTPAYLAFHALIIWSTLFGRTVTWAGRTYRVDAQHRVVAMSGDASAGEN
jgi:cellulose synthase/poly-beta-1,6-N-acetylglucosamine synthase-like glycosyltransferase